MASLNLATLSVEIEANGVQQAQQQINNLTGTMQSSQGSTTGFAGTFSKLGENIKETVGQTKVFGTSLGDLGGMFSGAGGMASLMQGAVMGLGMALVNMATQALAQAISGLKDFMANGIAMASDLEEIQNVVDVTFGNNAKEIDNWAKTSVEAFGLTELQAKKFSSTTGAIVNGMGVTGKQAADMSKRVAELSGDMASFYNLGHDEAFEKIRAGIIGETEPLKSLGIVMTETNLSAFALAQGLEQPYNKLSESEKVMVRYNFILEKTSLAHGDFARTSDSYANSQKTLANTVDILGVSFGEGLLPALGSFNTSLGDILKTFQPLMSLLGSLIGGVLQTLLNLIQPIINAFKIVMAVLNPIIQVVEGLLNAFLGMVNGMFTAMMSVLKPAIDMMLDWFNGLKEPIDKAMKFIADSLLAIPNGFIDAVNFCIEQLNKLPNVAIQPIEKLKTGFTENMKEMKESSEDLTDSLTNEVEKLPTTWDKCFEQIMGLTDEKYDGLKDRAKQFNYEMQHLDDEYAEYKSKLMTEEEKRLDRLYEKNGANALEIARIKALELAEYEQNIDREISKFREKDEVQRTSSLQRQKALIDEQSEREKQVKTEKSIMDIWTKTNETAILQNDSIIKQYDKMLEAKMKVANVKIGEGSSSGRSYFTGTNYHPGGLAVVGELGRELVDLPRGSKVYNNRQTEDMLSSNGGNNGVVNTYNISINADNVREFNDIVEICNQSYRG